MKPIDPLTTLVLATSLCGVAFSLLPSFAGADYLRDGGGGDNNVGDLEYEPVIAFEAEVKSAKKKENSVRGSGDANANLSGDKKQQTERPNGKKKKKKKYQQQMTGNESGSSSEAVEASKNKEDGQQEQQEENATSSGSSAGPSKLSDWIDTPTIYVNTSSFDTIEDYRKIISDHVRLRLDCSKIKGLNSNGANKLSRIKVPNDLCAGEQPDVSVSRYVVLSSQHSGTSWLNAMLSRHPQVYNVHEILFDRNNIGLTDAERAEMKRRRDASVTIADYGWQNTYFQSVCLMASSDACTEKKRLKGYNSTIKKYAIGFGIQGNQGWYDSSLLKTISPIWKANDVRVIVLERRNKIAHGLAGGGTTAMNGKGGCSESNLAHLSNKTLMGLKREVERKHERYASLKESIRKAGIPMLYVTYEAMAREPAEEYGKLFDFLLGDEDDDEDDDVDGDDGGIPKRWQAREEEDGQMLLHDSLNRNWTLVLGGSSKRHKKTLRDRIDNYDEAMEMLTEIYPKGACMLDEDCDWFY